MNYEENPFQQEQVAKEWMTSVENEKDMIRDKELYPMLEAWIGQLQPEVLVEIGSGQGICSSKLGDFNGKYIGVEPSQPLVDRAQELYKTDKREFLVGNAYHLPLLENIANAGFSVNVWFHLENLEQASSELARILKPEGKFLIVTANPKNYKVWESFYFDHTQEGKKIVGKVNVPINPMAKSTFYQHTLDEITSTLQVSGLKITNIQGFGYTEKHKDDGLFIRIEGYKDAKEN